MIHCITAVMMALFLGICFPCSPSFISLNRWKSEGTKLGLYGGCSRDYPDQIGSVLRNLQIGMGPGVVQEKGCLLWPDLRSSSLQLSQHLDVVIRIDGLSRFREIQKDCPFPIPKDSARNFTCWRLYWAFYLMRYSHITTSWTVILSPPHSDDTISYHW